MIALWERFARHFRNWESNPEEDGSFSDTIFFDEQGRDWRCAACIMPCGFISKFDGRARAWLQLEYASTDNARVEKEEGVKATALKSLVETAAEALSEMFPGLWIFVYEEEHGYYMLNLCGTEEQADELYEAALMAAEMTESNPSFHAAHECIG